MDYEVKADALEDSFAAIEAAGVGASARLISTGWWLRLIWCG